MSDDGEEKVIDLTRKFSIMEMLEQKAAAKAMPERPPQAEPEPESLPSLDTLAALPSPGDPYKAHARPANQMLPSLFILKGDGQKWSFPYSSRIEGPHLLSGDDPGKGPALVLRFSASVTVEVTLAGRHLDELHNYLGYHRIAWVRELPKGKFFTEAGVPVITRVEITQADGWPPLGVG